MVLGMNKNKFKGIHQIWKKKFVKFVGRLHILGLAFLKRRCLIEIMTLKRSFGSLKYRRITFASQQNKKIIAVGISSFQSQGCSLNVNLRGHNLRKNTTFYKFQSTIIVTETCKTLCFFLRFVKFTLNEQKRTDNLPIFYFAAKRM